VPLPRGDVGAFMGWFNANKGDRIYDGDEWYGRVWHGGVGAGWYWTEHLKTEIEFSGTSEGRIWATERVERTGAPTLFGFEERTYSLRKLSATQLYQFGHNEWVHGFVGGGVELEWEREAIRRAPLYDWVRTGTTVMSIQVRGEQTIGPHTRLLPYGIATAGIKAYITERAYFRTDVKVAARDALRNVVWRFGFGTDY
jgi:hypothetical protein